MAVHLVWLSLYVGSPQLAASTTGENHIKTRLGGWRGFSNTTRRFHSGGSTSFPRIGEDAKDTFW